MKNDRTNLVRKTRNKNEFFFFRLFEIRKYQNNKRREIFFLNTTMPLIV